jgi:acyl-CoA dehydrogenase
LPVAIDQRLDEGGFRAEARAWLAARLEPRPAGDAGDRDLATSTAVFPDLEGEAELVEFRREWERAKYDDGWGAVLTWPEEIGGRGLPGRFEVVFNEEEAAFRTPLGSEIFGVTQHLIAPTLDQWGQEETKAKLLRAMLRTDVLACQLFSEPDAGSDLAAVTTRAVRDGSDWVVTGRKVWTSGAQVCGFGEAICRFDPALSKHAGLVALLVPLDAPGVEIRPIRQMTGGSSFNEVVLDEVRVPAELQLGGDGDGWKVALTTLSAERLVSGAAPTAKFERLAALARHLDRNREPAVRDALTELYLHTRVQHFLELRAREIMLRDGRPGPEGSVGKLLATRNATRISTVASVLLGPGLVVDTGVPGTYVWAEHVLGAPAFRIAGGTDEIQRTIIGERVLGLPPEPKPAPRSPAGVPAN